jgi:hypothetical protein
MLSELEEIRKRLCEFEEKKYKYQGKAEEVTVHSKEENS